MFSFLLSTIQNSDDLRFMTVLCEEHKELMYDTARKYTHDPTLADDIVQESLVKLIEKISTLRGLECCKLKPYIVSTIRNTARNEFRRSRIRRKYHEPMPEEDPIDPISLEDMHLVLFRKHRLNSVWEQLSENEKLLLESKPLLGLTDIEVAEILGCKASSVRMLRTRARRHAIELIQQMEDE